MALCDACSAISIAALTKQVAQPADRSPAFINHLDDARDLPASAAACPFCALIQAAVLQTRTAAAETSPALHGRLGNAPVSLQLTSCFGRHRIDRVPYERSYLGPGLLGTAITAYVPTAQGDPLTGRIRLYADDGSAAAVCGDILGGPPLPSSNCPEAFDMARNWVDVCTRNHASCRRTLSKRMLDETEEPVLPTRVIDVLPCDGSQNVRLLETHGMRGRYIALSHCWGEPGKHPVTTTLETLRQHLSAIPWNRLPKTFRDAITVVRELNIRYIWIDSLCILQDDEADWRHESRKMGTVYQRAHLTIGACHAANSTEGCFFQRDAITQPVVELPYWNAAGERDGHVYASLVPYDYRAMSPASSPLNERAWATQEWLLSRRMLFYTKECMIWSCRTLNQRETRESFGDVARNTRWKVMIEEYSTRKLTRPTDRLIALEGIIGELQKRNNTKCIQGMWIDTRADQLLWFPLKPARREENAFKVPSWTWASCCPGIRYQRIGGAKVMCRLLNMNEKALQAVGFVKEAPCFRPLLQYQAPSRKDSLTDMECQGAPDARVAKILDEVRETGLPVDMSYFFCDAGGNPFGWATLDEGCLPIDQVHCLSVLGRGKDMERWQRWDETAGFAQHWMLLLVHVGASHIEGSAMYKRVGVGMVRARGWFANREVQRVMII